MRILHVPLLPIVPVTRTLDEMHTGYGRKAPQVIHAERQRPIDLAVYETDTLRIKLQKRIDETDPYFQMVHTQWGEGLRRVFAQLPDPDWT